MKSRILCFMLAFSHTFAAAAEPSPQSVERLFELRQTQKQFIDLGIQFQTVLRRQFEIQMGVAEQTGERQKDLIRFIDDCMAQMSRLMDEHLGAAKLLPILERIFRETLTQEEVDALLAHYETPAGKKISQLGPKISKQLLQAFADRNWISAAIESKAQGATIREVVREEVRGQMDASIEHFVSTMSNSEASELVRFYDSPAGLSIVEKLPAIEARFQSVLRENYALVTREARTAFRDIAAQMEQENQSKRVR